MTVSFILIFGMFVSILWMFWHLASFTPFIVVSVIVIIFAFLGEIFFTDSIKPHKRVNQKRIIHALPERHRSKREFYKILTDNSWLVSLDDPFPPLEKLWLFAKQFSSDSERYKFVSIDEKGFALLDEYRVFFLSHNNLNREAFIGFLVDGISVEKAQMILEKRRAQSKWWSKVGVWLEDRVSRTMTPVVAIWDVVKKTVQSAYLWWKEMCPFDTPPQKIQ